MLFSVQQTLKSLIGSNNLSADSSEFSKHTLILSTNNDSVVSSFQIFLSFFSYITCVNQNLNTMLTEKILVSKQKKLFPNIITKKHYVY